MEYQLTSFDSDTAINVVDIPVLSQNMYADRASVSLSPARRCPRRCFESAGDYDDRMFWKVQNSLRRNPLRWVKVAGRSS